MREWLIIHKADSTGGYVKVKIIAEEDWRYFQMGHLKVKYTSFNFRNVNLKEIDLHVIWMLKQRVFCVGVMVRLFRFDSIVFFF